MSAGAPLLEIEELQVANGQVEAVRGVSLRVDEGQIVTLIGPNGAGKTSILSALSGLVRPRAGRVRLGGLDVTGLPAHRTVAAGLSRQFVLDMPSGKTGWLFIGTATKAPRVYDGNGTPISIDQKDQLPAIGTRMVLPTDGNGATVFDLTTAPDGTKWHIVAKPDGSYQVLLRLLEPTRSGKADVTLSLWGLRRDDGELLKGLKVK